EVILFDGVDNDDDLNCIQSLLYSKNASLPINEIFDPNGDQNSIVVILESSGTTGAQKGAMMGHYDIATLILSSNNPLMKNSNGDEILMGCSPLAHYSGVLTHLTSLLFGATVVTLRNSTVETVMDAIERYQVTRTILASTTMNLILKSVKNVNCNSLRKVFVGGMRVPKGVGEEFLNKFNVKELHNVYTMTEITMMTTLGENELNNYHAIGKVCDGMQIKVVNPETEKLLGENELGEIRVKGPFAFKGYYKKEKLSRELIDDDGFIKTGDIGYFNENETFYIVDRIKDIIKHFAFGFSPVDVEEILITHEAVKEVAVVGIPDTDEGEVPHAFIVLKDDYLKMPIDKQIFIDFVNSRVMNLKHIQHVHFVKDIPKTNFGKILRRKIREQYLATI
ncbi:hypothetical protein B4U80_03723, partial [Leptotrombidium deliense]